MMFIMSGQKGTYKICAKTDIGTKRKVNQDAICWESEEIAGKQAVLLVVCDGVGSLQDGELASKSCVSCLKEWFDYEFIQLDKNDTEAMKSRMIRVVKEQNQILYQYAQEKGVQMGTTVTAMVIAEGQYHIVQVGDSRAYELGRKLLQLTEDQSFIAQEIKNGRMTEQDAQKDPRKNIILQSVGSASIVEPVFTQGKVKKNASYLLCSDGFYKRMQKEEILSLANNEQIEDSLEKAIERIKARGETDNISAVLAQFEMGEHK